MQLLAKVVSGDIDAIMMAADGNWLYGTIAVLVFASPFAAKNDLGDIVAACQSSSQVGLVYHLPETSLIGTHVRIPWRTQSRMKRHWLTLCRMTRRLGLRQSGTESFDFPFSVCQCLRFRNQLGLPWLEAHLCDLLHVAGCHIRPAEVRSCMV